MSPYGASPASVLWPCLERKINNLKLEKGSCKSSSADYKQIYCTAPALSGPQIGLGPRNNGVRQPVGKIKACTIAAAPMVQLYSEMKGRNE